MPSYKSYSIEQYTAFLSQPFSNNFGISEDDTANWFMGQAGAQPVVRRYGITRQQLIEVYIPELKSAYGGGYFLFLAITVTEGGGAGNWLNHYLRDQAVGGLACMQSDIAYTKTTFTKQFPPAMSAPEVGGTYIEDVPGQTLQVYNAVPENSIGSYFMPSTMAGNAWVFGEAWCLRNQGAAPPAVYFGNPYDDIIRTIMSTGADPFGDAPALPNPDPPQPENDGNKGNMPSDLGEEARKIAEALINFFQKGIDFDAYQLAREQRYSNGFIQLMRTYGNRYHLSFTEHFWNELNKILNTRDLELNGSGVGQQDKNPDGSNNKPPSIASGKDLETMQAMLDWCIEREGQSFDYDGVWGAQCVDLITWLNGNVFNLGLDLSGNYAKDIYRNPVPSDWEKVEGDPNSWQASRDIWNTLPQGAIVWYGNGGTNGAGHVAIKAGDWGLVYNQNVDDPYGRGGPIRRTDLGTWVSSGQASFLGAWVKLKV